MTSKHLSVEHHQTPKNVDYNHSEIPSSSSQKGYSKYTGQNADGNLMKRNYLLLSGVQPGATTVEISEVFKKLKV